MTSNCLQKNEKMETSEDIQSRYWDGIWHRKISYVNNEKQKTTGGRNRTSKSRQKIRTLGGKVTYKYSEILVVDAIKRIEMKGKFEKEYLRRTRKLLETQLHCRNLIKDINTWAVLLIRYSRPFLKWTREILQQMDHRTRKPITIYKCLHPRDNRDCTYQEKKGKDLPTFKITLMHRHNVSKIT